VREDDAFRCFADAFAQIELHLQRSLADPLDDTAYLIALAEQRAVELEKWQEQVSPGAAVTNPVRSESVNLVQDAEISSEFRQVFIEETDEIVCELIQLSAAWSLDPQPNEVLRDIRRHFHTFKGNGRAVGANILGELGWAVQDMLDRVLDGELALDARVGELLQQVVAALPSLVGSYRNAGEWDVANVRHLTNRCFLLAKSSERRSATQFAAAEALRAQARPVSPAAATGAVSH
jgi:hypothetical protein